MILKAPGSLSKWTSRTSLELSVHFDLHKSYCKSNSSTFQGWQSRVIQTGLIQNKDHFPCNTPVHNASSLFLQKIIFLPPRTLQTLHFEISWKLSFSTSGKNCSIPFRRRTSHSSFSDNAGYTHTLLGMRTIMSDNQHYWSSLAP